MIILGIESSCDETGISVVENGRKVIINVLATSADIFKKYGGIVPEVAAREQVRVIVPLISEVLRCAPVDKIDAIAVSYGPGLIGSLLVGVEAAKTLAIVYKKPLIAVNHLEGHFYSCCLESRKDIELPAIGLIVSGGHTDLVLVKKHGEFNIKGSTLDDAAGEAFDKVARFLQLSYPGGPEIERTAASYKERNGGIDFPKPMIDSNEYDFSFSGLKTAVVNYVQRNKLEVNSENVAMIAYYFQKSAVEVLVSKTMKAASSLKVKSIVVGGGVTANKFLREQLQNASRDKFNFYSPLQKYAVDNGAMIAAAAFHELPLSLHKRVDNPRLLQSMNLLSSEFKNIFTNPLTLKASPSLHF